MVTIAPGVVTIGDGRAPAELRRETPQNAQEGGGGVGRRQLLPRTDARPFPSLSVAATGSGAAAVEVSPRGVQGMRAGTPW